MTPAAGWLLATLLLLLLPVTPALAQRENSTPTLPQGNTSGVAAPAGAIGELITSKVLCSTNTGLSNQTTTNITSISLTPGDWDVYGGIGVDGAGSTTVANVTGGVTAVGPTTLPNIGSTASVDIYPVAVAGQTVMTPAGLVQALLATTTTYYVNVNASFATSTAGFCGYLYARRVR